MATNPTAALSVMADHLDRYQQDVGEFVVHVPHDDDGDILAALVEAERALRTAARQVRRAAKLTERSDQER